MAIKKYSMDAGVDGFLSSMESDYGEWCKASDVEKLQRERDALKLLNASLVAKGESALGDLLYLLKHQKTNSEDGSKLVDGESANDLMKLLDTREFNEAIAELQAKAVDTFADSVPWSSDMELGDFLDYSIEYIANLRNDSKGDTPAKEIFP